MAETRAYDIIERVQVPWHGAVCRAIRVADGRPVVLKMVDGSAAPRDQQQLRNEYETTKFLETPAALETLGFDSDSSGVNALVFEDFRAQSLDRLLGAAMPVDRFLRLALRIASAVAEVHRHGVIHKDIKPSNILVTTDESEVKIAGFGLASRLPSELQALEPPRMLEGTLAYLSPEQTGRMNRIVDSRSDLYALGVTFYEMLTGRLPFQGRDPIEWVYNHLARVPVPPSEIAAVPVTLSNIVVRLLAKQAEDRYQSAIGLVHDLERCLTSWSTGGAISPFTLGEQDAVDRFRIPQQLYGRRAELKTLHAAFADIRDTGRSAVVTVSGHAGIGKSTLVHELLKSIVQERGFFVEGKFDQYKRNIPYASIGQAFAGLVRELLAERKERLAAIRKDLYATLGSVARLITQTIPEMELVIGPQPPVSELPPVEAEHRFHTTFARFVGVLAKHLHPLVLFLDDLQWTDAASLRLLESTLIHPDVSHVLLIGAYRSEADAAQSVTEVIERIRRAGRRVDDVVLGPLSIRHLTELVADTVRRPRSDAAPLAHLLGEKTAGNPFFAIQFLSELEREGMLAYDPTLRGWQWDLERIREKGYTDNVVDLMVLRLGRLTTEARDVCALAACVGNEIDAETLAAVSGRSTADLQVALHGAIEHGLIVRSGNRYRFAHDRVQQAAYSLIPPADRPALHLRAGRVLFERTPAEKRDEHIFEIVSQLNRGRAAMPEADSLWTAELNLAAGRRARGAVAYEAGVEYLARGAELLPPDPWTAHYDLTFALHLEQARCHYLRACFDDATRILDEVVQHAKTNVDAAAAYRTWIELDTTRDRPAAAVESAIACLRLLGVELTLHPSWSDVLEAHDALQARLGDRAIEDLADLPSMTDPSLRAAMEVLCAVNAPALFTDLNCYYIVGCRLVDLSIRYGNTDSSCSGYALYGYLLGAGFGHYEEATRFGRLGYDLVESRNLVGEKAKVLVDYAVVASWTEPLETCRSLWRQAFESAVEAGDLTYACYASTFLVWLSVVRGDPLDEAHRRAERSLSFVRDAKFFLCEAMIVGLTRLIDQLRGRATRLVTIAGEELDEDAFEARLADPALAWATSTYYICQLQARFLAGDFHGALSAARKAAPSSFVSRSFPQAVEQCFYEALALASTYETSNSETREQSLAAIEAHEAQLGHWSKGSRTNFLAKHALVRAELARLRGHDLEAVDAYEQAIRTAYEERFVNTEALAYELAARFYAGRGQHEVADLYMGRARSCYARWGADAKVQQLDELHPKAVEPRGSLETTRVAFSLEQLDSVAVIQASQAISREIVLADLVQTLLRLVTELGGAQRGYLVLVRNGRLRVEAEATLSAAGVSTRKLSLPLGPTILPRSILEHTRRARERVVLDDALRSERFGKDPYVVRASPRSVLCLPVRRQAEVIGLIYLENRTAAGLFGFQRLAALEVLAAQAAISLESALLVERERVSRAEAEAAERRTAFLGQATLLLGESLEHERTLGALARHCVGSLCDWCVVDLAQDGELKRIASAHVDPRREHLLDELRAYPPRSGTGVPPEIVRETGKPLRLPKVTGEMLRSGCVDERHYRIMRGLGTRSVIVVPLLSRGEVLGVLTLVSAKATRRFSRADFDLAQELGSRAASAIDNARLYADAQTAIKIRDEFLSVASHELRTPLAVLKLAIQGARYQKLLGTYSSEAETSLFRRVEHQVERLSRLVGALLEVSRIHAGRLDLVREEMDLAELVRDAADQLSAELQQSGSSLRVEASTPVPGHWDSLRLEQVVINLLSNAIKFGQGNPITLRAEATPDGAILTVNDHGIGISPDLHLFERFSRGVSARQYGGLGLGLYITRSIVEAHGGTLRVSSDAAAGTTFTVALPFDAPEERGRYPFPAEANAERATIIH